MCTIAFDKLCNVICGTDSTVVSINCATAIPGGRENVFESNKFVYSRKPGGIQLDHLESL